MPAKTYQGCDTLLGQVYSVSLEVKQIDENTFCSHVRRTNKRGSIGGYQVGAVHTPEYPTEL